MQRLPVPTFGWRDEARESGISTTGCQALDSFLSADRGVGEQHSGGPRLGKDSKLHSLPTSHLIAAHCCASLVFRVHAMSTGLGERMCVEYMGRRVLRPCEARNMQFVLPGPQDIIVPLFPPNRYLQLSACGLHRLSVSARAF